jgi:hypothetical protein
MSEPAPPELTLAAARRHLAARGYLQPSLPEPPASFWRGILVAVGWAAILAAALAWVAAAGAGAELVVAVPLAAGFFPASLGAMLGGGYIGRRVGWWLVRLGAPPPAAATALGALAGGGVVAGLVLVGGAPSRLSLLGAPGLALGLSLAVVVFMRARAALIVSLGYRPTRAAHPGLGALLALAAGLAVLVLAAALAGNGNKAPTTVAAAYPPPQGRLAVLAVDGLAREDLAGAVELWGQAGLRELAAWGWGKLSGITTVLPAVLWTTAACGVPPSVHGVIELEEVRLFGGSAGVPLTAAGRAVILGFWRPLGAAAAVARPALARRTPAFWEMASRAGCPVTVGGWWGSWPVRRVLGEVLSERAWLGGGTGADAVTPLSGPLVQAAWKAGGEAAAVTDALALNLAGAVPGGKDAHIIALSLPALDLCRRQSPQAPPLALASTLRPHYRALGEVVELLRAASYTVFVVGVPWHSGTPFVASSGAWPGEAPAVAVTELATTWLASLGLPPAEGLPAPRTDLLARATLVLPAVAYGPPPPPFAAPSSAGVAVQREVLRSLGYLQ